MQGIEFDEDKSILSPMEKEEKPPETGFEGWFYRTFPGTFKSKRTILLSIILFIFAISFVIMIMARYNSITYNNAEKFSDRIFKTKLK